VGELVGVIHQTTGNPLICRGKDKKWGESGSLYTNPCRIKGLQDLMG
jgi:hypothetical protein